MNTTTFPRLLAAGHELDTAPASFGELRSSIDLIEDTGALRERMAEDGYLYLRGYLDREEVIAARQVIMERLAEQGALDPAFPCLDGVARAGANTSFQPDLAAHNAPLHRVLYAGRMMEFYENFLGGAVRHFDFTWLRAVSPGKGTALHCDIVFMGRGTPNLCTAWTPLGDVSYELGGLMILENSHQNERLRAGYGSKDVDTYCSNRRAEAPKGLGGGGTIKAGGALTNNPATLRERLGGRWLSTEFRMGDLLTFGMYTIHASLDNQSNRIRCSSDSRYQLASEPADERWIGPNPIGHGPNAKRGLIC